MEKRDEVLILPSMHCGYLLQQDLQLLLFYLSTPLL